MSASQLTRVVNLLLPTNWKVEIAQDVQPDWQQVRLPQLALSYQQCSLLNLTDLEVNWQMLRLRIGNVTLNYACFERFPKDTSESSHHSLNTMIASLPEGEIEIQALHWVNLPDTLSNRLKGLLSTPSYSQIKYHQQVLHATIDQQQFTVSATLDQQHLSGTVDYHPIEQEQHHFVFNAKLHTNITALPRDLFVEYQWQLPESVVAMPLLQTGQAYLTWQANDSEQIRGRVQIQLNRNEQNQFDFPFYFDGKSIGIEQGQIQSNIIPNFPIRAFISTHFSPSSFQSDKLYPIQTQLRLSLLSQNDKGKGNIVISNQAGEISETGLVLPLQITGNVKQNNYILYSTIPLDLRGNFDDLKLKFLQGALLRVTGKERFLTIHDLRFPLAGIQIDKYGINGRLQAIFKGESPDFKAIEMHLDGLARHFKAGALHFFDDFPNPKAIKNNWQWRFWGYSQLSAIPNKMSLSGRGQWQTDLIQLSEFKGNLDKIHQQAIFIPKIDLGLTQPINFRYDQRLLTGGITINATKIHFDYGGELQQPKADLTFNGDIENLNFKGQFSAGKLGPIRFFARRQLSAMASDLIGKLYWSEQPANVFQSLFPFRNNWLITNGTIKGETAFSANINKGIVAGGHFAIHQGAISLPNGEISGLEFSLPYQFKHNQVHIGHKKPLELRAELINLGVPLRHLRVKIQGHFPYTKHNPLVLQQLSLDLLGGKLTVDKFALPQKQIAYLNLTNISFDEILNLAQYHQLKLSGRANATLPFWLSGKPCYICDGWLSQTQPSRLKFSPMMIEALQKAGYTEKILAYLVNDSQFNHFNAKIDLDKQGNLSLQAQIRSQLAAHQTAKLNLNYHHRENVFDLWQLINYGSQFEQHIEHNLYQKLDR